MNLIKLEEVTGKSYTAIVSEFEQLSSEIIERQKAAASLKEDQESQEKTLQELIFTKEKTQTEVEEVEKKAEQQKAELDAAAAIR